MFCKAIADLVVITLDGLGGLAQCVSFGVSIFQWNDWFGECSPWQRFSEFAVMLQFRVSCDADLNSGTC